MNTLLKLFSVLLTLLIAACGPGGDTEALKQTIETNKLSIVSVIIKPKYTLTISPVTTPPANPKYYVAHNDTEQLQVYGITAANEEVPLNNATWLITDNTSTAGATSIDQNGLLRTESLSANQSKELAVSVRYASLAATADIVISAYPLSAGGLSIYMNNAVVNGLTQAVVACDTAALTAIGLFDDGSSRDVTSKINWAASISDSNAKFVTTDPSTALFSAHTNADYVVTPDYAGQGSATVTLQLTNSGLSNLSLGTGTLTLAPTETDTLTLTADINTGSGNINENVTSRAKWSSANTATFTVSSAGLLTGVAIGTANVTAQCGTATATASVTVENDASLLYIKILDADSLDTTRQDLIVGNAVNLKLRAYMADSSELDISSDENTSWSVRTLTGSGTPVSVNNTDNKGRISADSVGTAEVVATYKGREDDLYISVTAE